MCKAHVLRFCCGHGVLMGIELCNLGPCPLIKTSGNKLPQQPYKCHNCQCKRTSSGNRPLSSRGGSCSSNGSMESDFNDQPTPLSRIDSRVGVPPLPGIVRQPSDLSQLSFKMRRTSSSITQRPFSFSCSSSSHFPTPHYVGLPGYLPHQDHPCPPCQLENYRIRADQEAQASAMAQFPHLTKDMLVRNGRTWEEWQSKPTLQQFVEERRDEERQMWLHVTRKWTQDLRRSRVLVAEEDGLGLLG